MALDVTQATVLLRLPFSGDLLVEGRVDGAVELVHIGGMDAVLEQVVFGAQPFDGFLVLAPLIGVAVVKGVAHPVQHLVVERQPAEEHAELLFEGLFPDIGLVAFSLVAGAVVADVALLLDLADHRAAAMTAGDQAREGEITLDSAVLVGVAALAGDGAGPKCRIDLGHGGPPMWNFPAVEGPEMDPVAEFTANEPESWNRGIGSGWWQHLRPAGGHPQPDRRAIRLHLLWDHQGHILDVDQRFLAGLAAANGPMVPQRRADGPPTAALAFPP